MRPRLVGLAVLLGVALAGVACQRFGEAAGSEMARSQPRVVISAAGRVEGASEAVEISAALDGVLAEVLAKEGDAVEAGEVLARLACRDLEARLEAVVGMAEGARQSRQRLLRGSREEERWSAEAATASALAVLEDAQLRFERTKRLAESPPGIIAANDLDQARRDLRVAEAAHYAALAQEKLVKSGPLPEEVAKADAEVRAAEGRQRESAALVEKCVVRAPASGRVLRVHLAAGEAVSFLYPRPIVSLADTSRLRVRAEVDERDVGRIRLGQTALIRVDALPDREFRGRVSRLAAVMGRKHVKSGDPAEKSDRDVQEVVVDLEEGDPALVTGLRVTVLFAE